MSARAARAGLVVALVSASTVAGSGAPVTAAGVTGYCPDASGVTVVVDFNELGGGTVVRCASGDQATGLAALKNAGFQITGTLRWGGGFICRIEGKPSTESEKCVDTPPANAYWSYWHAANGGSWMYSDKGVLNRKPPAGSFEGWSFSLNRNAGDAPPPGVAPKRPAPSAPPTPPPPPPPTPPSVPPVPPLAGGGRPASPPQSAGGRIGVAGPPPTSASGPAPASTPPVSRPAPTSIAATTTLPAVGGTGSPLESPDEPVMADVAAPPDGAGLPLSTAAGTLLLAAIAAGGAMVARRRRTSSRVTDRATHQVETAARIGQKRPTWSVARLPRALHPGAWWLWALGLATAASHTTNPLPLGLLVALGALVVVLRRGDAPWALAFRTYLVLGAAIVAMRVVFRIVFGGGQGDHVLVRLPEISLPAWAAGIRLFGPVAAEQVLGGLYDGLRLATMLVCFGAANALANPKRLLKAVPGALYAVGTAVVVALSVAPQLVESVLRVRRARRLRGASRRGMRALRGIALPVLADSLERSLALAAAMDSRGYGRTAAVPASQRAATSALVLSGLVGVSAGAYGLLDATGPGYLGMPLLLAGLAAAVAGMLLAGRRVRRSRYRPDHWRPAELLVAGCGIVAATLTMLAGAIDPELLFPSVSPLTWPELTPTVLLAIAVAAAPAWLAPPPPVARDTRSSVADPSVPIPGTPTDAVCPTTSSSPATGGSS